MSAFVTLESEFVFDYSKPDINNVYYSPECLRDMIKSFNETKSKHAFPLEVKTETGRLKVGEVNSMELDEDSGNVKIKCTFDNMGTFDIVDILNPNLDKREERKSEDAVEIQTYHELRHISIIGSELNKCDIGARDELADYVKK